LAQYQEASHSLAVCTASCNRHVTAYDAWPATILLVIHAYGAVHGFWPVKELVELADEATGFMFMLFIFPVNLFFNDMEIVILITIKNTTNIQKYTHKNEEKLCQLKK